MGSDTKSRVFGMAKNPFVIFSRNHIIQPSRATYMVVYLHHWWIATAQGRQPRPATAPRIAPWIPSRLCGISLLPCGRNWVDNMIEAIGLTKYYGKTLAVDDLSFTVRPGAVTGFLGPNGSGKSTTMRLILGLDNPSRGSTKVAGHQYAHLTKPLTQVGALLDANWIHPNRSARSHLRFMAASNKIPVSRVDEVLEIVGLSSVAKRAAGQFSLGMKQRLGLAGALRGDPQVLLFDEPVNGLDPEGIFWVRTFMRNLAAQGKTVFVSSHLLSEMALTADHLIVIGRGRLIADSSTEEFIARSTQTSARVRPRSRSATWRAPRASPCTSCRRRPDRWRRRSSGSPGIRSSTAPPARCPGRAGSPCSRRCRRQVSRRQRRFREVRTRHHRTGRHRKVRHPKGRHCRDCHRKDRPALTRHRRGHRPPGHPHRKGGDHDDPAQRGTHQAVLDPLAVLV